MLQIVKDVGAGERALMQVNGVKSARARRERFKRRVAGSAQGEEASDRQVFVAEVGVLQHLVRRALPGDRAHVEDDGAIGELQRGDGVLLDDDRGDAESP